MLKRLMVAATAVALIGAAAPTAPAATAPHWAGTGERTLYLENHLPIEWLIPLKAAVANWNRSPYINIVIVPGNNDCWDLSTPIAFCWEHYDTPQTTWIGMTSWWVDARGHFRGTVSEANEQKSWGPGKRRFVACHELGHALGLEHQPSTSGSDCMMARFSYITVFPARPSPADYSALTGLYSHDD